MSSTPTDPLHPVDREITQAKIAFTRVMFSRDDDTTYMGFSALVVAVEKAFQKLAILTKGEPKTKVLMDRARRDRKQDELLNYVKQVRHADSHTARDLASRSDGRITILAGEPVLIKGMNFDEFGQLIEVIHDPAYAEPRVRAKPPGFYLEPVVNRGNHYMPPKSHLGKEIDGFEVLVVGFYTLYYYRKLVEDVRNALQ